MNSISLTPTNDTPSKFVFLHLQYHPKDPDSKIIQNLFRKHVYKPISITDTLPLPEIHNFNGAPNGIERLIVGYSRPHNLGNILSSRIIDKKSGLPVSAFI